MKEVNPQTTARAYVTVSFQFHHTQMDGAHVSAFLDALQREIDGL